MNRDPSKAFLGVGWAFPLAFAADRSVATVVYEDDVRQAIRIILGTDRGERLMRPDFGAGLSDFLFEPVTATTAERIRNRVREALIDWEPRIDVTEVKVEAAGERNRLDIDIEYRVRATNTLHNLVYPFYLDEGGSR
ncbi:MAG TPA: GPW/gp25 family protein [Thermoanaerobaculia bacterium]